MLMSKKEAPLDAEPARTAYGPPEGWTVGSEFREYGEQEWRCGADCFTRAQLTPQNGAASRLERSSYP